MPPRPSSLMTSYPAITGAATVPVGAAGAAGFVGALAFSPVGDAALAIDVVCRSGATSVPAGAGAPDGGRVASDVLSPEDWGLVPLGAGRSVVAPMWLASVEGIR